MRVPWGGWEEVWVQVRAQQYSWGGGGDEARVRVWAGSRRIRARAQQDSGGSGNVQARVRAQVLLSSSVWHDTSAGPTDVYNSSLLIRNDSHHRVHSNTNAIMVWAWMLQ